MQPIILYGKPGSGKSYIAYQFLQMHKNSLAVTADACDSFVDMTNFREIKYLDALLIDECSDFGQIERIKNWLNYIFGTKCPGLIFTTQQDIQVHHPDFRIIKCSFHFKKQADGY